MSEGVARVRVMLLDDHQSFRQSLAFILEQEQDIEMVAQVGSLHEAREAFGALGPAAIDVALVDLDLPDGSGEDFVADLHDARPRLPVLVLSASSEEGLISRAIEAGAMGVLNKLAPVEEVADAIRRLHAGEQLLSQEEIIEALRLVSRERRQDSEARFLISKLTTRELEVLQALAEGLDDRGISDRLFISVNTVRGHVTSILQKLAVDSRLQALVFAVRHGLVRMDR